MSCKKPSPILDVPERPHCPVCGEVSYSRGGIHPQCAQTQADEKQLKRVKSLNKTKKNKIAGNVWSASTGPRAWHKWCPKCKKQVHVRKKACSCGHDFKP